VLKGPKVSARDIRCTLY